ncbi:MAG: glycosyltransferase family 4 protein [Chthoniobacteraceae bacterium]
MKLLIFAHTPPPHHGQSYMVKLLLDGLRKNSTAEAGAAETPIECYHINCRYSEEMEDIGELQLGKIWLLLRYCFQAVWYRFRHGVKYFYYVPAPGKRVAIYRDWIIMLLCRPFFKEIIFHWHAVGLGDWLDREGFWFEKFLTRHLLRHPDLSIVLAISNMRDALWFETRRLEIVPNGIPDPCPDFEQNLLPCRLARTSARRKSLEPGTSLTSGDQVGANVFKILYLAHCTRTKGLFDTLEAAALINPCQPLPTVSHPASLPHPPNIHLTVAGAFLDPAEQKEFQQRIQQPDLKDRVTYAGFVSGDAKTQLLRSSDCLCFPTYYEAEGQPVNLIEAMAFGLPVITTRWRAIPEILPPDYPCFVAPRSPREIAAAIQLLYTSDYAMQMRLQFTPRFTEARHLQLMKHALQ